MTPWTIQQQTLFVRGNLRLTFRKHGVSTLLDVDTAGFKYTVSFDPTGYVKSVRPHGKVDMEGRTG